MLEYTYGRLEGDKIVETIEGLSKDAAFEIARANSIVGVCIVTTEYQDDANNVFRFKDGRLIGSAALPVTNEIDLYALRVAELEAEGLTTSDAQGVADAELRK